MEKFEIAKHVDLLAFFSKDLRIKNKCKQAIYVYVFDTIEHKVQEVIISAKEKRTIHCSNQVHLRICIFDKKEMKTIVDNFKVDRGFTYEVSAE